MATSLFNTQLLDVDRIKDALLIEAAIAAPARSFHVHVRPSSELQGGAQTVPVNWDGWDKLLDALAAYGKTWVRGQRGAKSAELGLMSSKHTFEAIVPMLDHEEAIGFLGICARRDGVPLSDEEISALEAAGRVGAREVLGLRRFETATRDPVTGLWSGGYFLLRLEDEVSRSRRYGRALSILLGAIDAFDLVTLSRPEPIVNAWLRTVGDAVRQSVRNVDVPAWVGPGVFAALLPECDAQGVFIVAERARSAIEARRLADNGKLTASFGAASFVTGATVETLLTDAEERLEDARFRGGNRVVAR